MKIERITVSIPTVPIEVFAEQEGLTLVIEDRINIGVPGNKRFVAYFKEARFQSYGIGPTMPEAIRKYAKTISNTHITVCGIGVAVVERRIKVPQLLVDSVSLQQQIISSWDDAEEVARKPVSMKERFPGAERCFGERSSPVK